MFPPIPTRRSPLSASLGGPTSYASGRSDDDVAALDRTDATNASRPGRSRACIVSGADPRSACGQFVLIGNGETPKGGLVTFAVLSAGGLLPSNANGT